MKNLYLILGILLIISGLVLIMANPFIGVFLLLFGIIIIYLRNKLIQDDSTDRWVFNKLDFAPKAFKQKPPDKED